MSSEKRFLAIVVLLLATALILWGALRVIQRRKMVSSTEEATFHTLHLASLIATALGDGLTPRSARKAAKHLQQMLGATAIAITDSSGVIAWEVSDSRAERHRGAVERHCAPVLDSGRTVILRDREASCGDPECPARTVVAAPIVSDEKVVAALAAYIPATSPGMVRATEELAGWVSNQVELAELGHERNRAMEAELRALRAQISPHFIYNCLAAIASFVRTDPDRARELLLEFADFTRYAFRRSGAYTPLKDELDNIERYLELERARFGDRLAVSLRIAPEVLTVTVPFLAVQPLVENAVKHGIESKTGRGNITISATSVGSDAEISIEDDGIGGDPEIIRAILSGESERDSVGLGNVDARLRQAYGDEYGLVIETAPGAGTKVSFRVPKSVPGIDPKQ